MLRKSFHEVFHSDTHLLGYHEDIYMELQNYMEPCLGPAMLDVSVEGHCLEFHPLGLEQGDYDDEDEDDKDEDEDEVNNDEDEDHH